MLQSLQRFVQNDNFIVPFLWMHVLFSGIMDAVLLSDLGKETRAYTLACAGIVMVIGTLPLLIQMSVQYYFVNEEFTHLRTCLLFMAWLSLWNIITASWALQVLDDLNLPDAAQKKIKGVTGLGIFVSLLFFVVVVWMWRKPQGQKENQQQEGVKESVVQARRNSIGQPNEQEIRTLLDAFETEYKNANTAEELSGIKQQLTDNQVIPENSKAEILKALSFLLARKTAEETQCAFLQSQSYQDYEASERSSPGLANVNCDQYLEDFENEDKRYFKEDKNRCWDLYTDLQEKYDVFYKKAASNKCGCDYKNMLGKKEWIQYDNNPETFFEKYPCEPLLGKNNVFQTGYLSKQRNAAHCWDEDYFKQFYKRIVARQEQCKEQNKTVGEKLIDAGEVFKSFLGFKT